jgi:5-methylcytosine-specific restriction endonuclease McrA
MASIEYHQKYRAEHREAYREYARQERLANPEVIKERQKKWRQAHPEVARQAQFRWKNANKDRLRRYDTTYRINHREKKCEIEHRRRARSAGLPTLQIKTGLRAKWAYWGEVCWLCGQRATQTDHVKPIARGGAHLLCNLRPICKSCNSRKKDRWPVDTRRRTW